MRKTRPTLILACLWLICSSYFTTPVMAETTENQPVTSAGLETIIEQEEDNEVTISYVLEDKKELVLRTDQEEMIDLEALKEELGADNVQPTDSKQEIVVTLDNPDLIDFKLHVSKTVPFLLTVQDADRKEMFKHQFNHTENVDPLVDDDPAEESTWTRVDKLRVSKGPVLKNSDGSCMQPILYFGDYRYSESGVMKVSSTWIPRRKSRENSLTAPNSGIIYSEPGGKIEDGTNNPKNHLYTTHYGDSQNKDFNPALSAQEDLPYGTPTSYTSTNLFNFVSHSDNWRKPGTSGPNKVGKSYAMLGEPNLYYRIDPKTGFEEQRLVYKQRAFYNDHLGKTNPEITTRIKMSFTKTGRVVTDIAFKNTGKVLFNNFSGFSNHDLSLNKDGTELTDKNGKKIGNYIPIRSLGNERGMYFQAPNNEIRTTIYMDHEKGPAAWAARSASRGYLATKGYILKPGFLGFIGSHKEAFYPWKIGKPMDKNFYDKKTNTYKFSYTPDGISNAFVDQKDLGDKGQKMAAGTRLGTNKEKDPQWDAGVTMRSSPIDLEVGKTVHIQYGTVMDIPGTVSHPVVEYDEIGTEHFPKVLTLGTENMVMEGHWYDFDSQNVSIKYAIDSEDPEDIQKNTLMDDTQTEEEAVMGRFHDFSQKVSLDGLEKGMHKMYLIAEDGEGNKSVLQEHNFKLIKSAVENKGPQIDITSPTGTKRNPYIPVTDKFNLQGFWSDQNSKKIKSISYAVDGGTENVIQEDIDNPKLGELVPWQIKAYNISEYNDFEKHRLVVKITDENDQVDTDIFYFKHVGGGTHLVAPEEIDFGRVSVTPTSDQPIPTNLNGKKVLLEDFRKEGASPLKIKLSIKKFYKVTDNVDTDDEDDGDDSLSSIESRASAKDSLVHDVIWNGQAVNSKHLIVGKTDGLKSNEWRQTTDLTPEIEKKLRLNFRAKETGVSTGKYMSQWTWSTVDSIQ